MLPRISRISLIIGLAIRAIREIRGKKEPQ
jgi:hypothetical protein